MMIQFPSALQYMVESSLCLLVVYGLYTLLFSRTTFFQANRLYLLLGAALSFGLPLLHLTWVARETTSLDGLVVAVVSGTQQLIVEIHANMGQPTAATVTSLSWGQALGAIYCLGMLVFTARFLIRLNHLLRFMRGKGNDRRGRDTCSFFGWMFIHPRHEGEGREWIVEHEKVHIRQWHSLDVVFMEIITILYWFHPVAHIYHRKIREIHEFIADRYVAARSGDTYRYAQLLVQEVSRKDKPGLYNSFASLIKKRLIMLSIKNTRRRHALRYLAILPMVMLLMTLFSFNVVKTESLAGWFTETSEEGVVSASAFPPFHESEKISGDTLPTPRHPHSTPPPPPVPAVPQGERVFRMVEYMPHFAGCESLTDGKERKKCSDTKIIEFISSNIKYPPQAKDKGVDGTAVIRFIVEKDGVLSGFRLLKNPGEGCGEEALRVLKMFPDWIPGRQGGEPVRVQFTMPIRFALGDDVGEGESGK